MSRFHVNNTKIHIQRAGPLISVSKAYVESIGLRERYAHQKPYFVLLSVI